MKGGGDETSTFALPLRTVHFQGIGERFKMYHSRKVISLCGSLHGKFSLKAFRIDTSDYVTKVVIMSIMKHTLFRIK